MASDLEKRNASLRSWVGINELLTAPLWRAAAAELLGTTILVFVGCGTCLGRDWESAATPTAVQISLAFGITVATMVWCIAHISGGHINPAVSVAMFVTRNISLTRATVYVVAQSMGAILGSAVIAGVTSEITWGNLGMTTIDKTLSSGQGFGVELIITFILVFTIFASCDKKRTDLNGSTPLTIGLCVSACHMLAIKYTGSSMNPARSFGPAVVLSNYPQLTNDSKSCLLATPTSVSAVFNHTTAIMRPDTVTECPHNYENIWTDQWVYWIAPITGGIMAGLLYEFLFAANASLARGRALVTCQPLEDVDSYDVNRDTVAMTPVKYTKTEEGEMVVV